MELENIIKIAHRNCNKALCIYTDASDEFWAAVVTQCPREDVNEEIENQNHERLSFLKGSFKRHEHNWSTFEKEPHSIYQVFLKMGYMLLVEDMIHIYTDHRNLLFVFNPFALNNTISRDVISKVQRWGLYLSRFSYVIKHIEGHRNIIPDIMTRCCLGYRVKRMAPN